MIGFPCIEVAFAQLLDDFCARSGDSCQEFLCQFGFQIRPHEIIWEAVWIHRERLIQDNTTKFPVTCGCILACAGLGETPKSACGVNCWGAPLDISVRFPNPQFTQVG